MALLKLRYQNFHMQICSSSIVLSRWVCTVIGFTRGCQDHWSSLITPVCTICHMHGSTGSLVFIYFFSLSREHHAMQYVPMSHVWETAHKEMAIQPSLSVMLRLYMPLPFYLKVKMPFLCQFEWEVFCKIVLFMQLVSSQIVSVLSDLLPELLLSKQSSE